MADQCSEGLGDRQSGNIWYKQSGRATADKRCPCGETWGHIFWSPVGWLCEEHHAQFCQRGDAFEVPAVNLPAIDWAMTVGSDWLHKEDMVVSARTFQEATTSVLSQPQHRGKNVYGCRPLKEWEYGAAFLKGVNRHE